MSLVTVAQLKDFAPTDVSDANVQLMLDANEAELVRRFGPHASAVETFTGGTRLITLARPALSITSVVENLTNLDPGVTLVSTDYMFTAPYLLERIGSGYGWGTRTHQYPYLIWGRQVAVTYVPVDETKQRSMALIALCKLDLAFNGYSSLNLSGVTVEQPLDYITERERIFDTINTRKIGFV